jgi:hypothetical protein
MCTTPSRWNPDSVCTSYNIRKANDYYSSSASSSYSNISIWNISSSSSSNVRAMRIAVALATTVVGTAVFRTNRLMLRLLFWITKSVYQYEDWTGERRVMYNEVLQNLFCVTACTLNVRRSITMSKQNIWNVQVHRRTRFRRNTLSESVCSLCSWGSKVQ